MKKLLRPRDALLLGLAGALDIYEDFKDPLGLGTQEAKKLYGWVSGRFRRHNFRRVIERGLKTGDIEKIVKEDEVYLRLTSTGKETIVRDYPLFFLTKQKWDGKWRVVVFDVAEIEKQTRNRLRSKLRELGFGMLQESVWVTPHDLGKDIAEFLVAQKLDRCAFLLEVTTLVTGDRDFLVEKIWHLRDLNGQYLEILREMEKLKEWYITGNDRIAQHPSYEEKVKKIRERYLGVFLTDPCLPKELLPEDWVGEKVKKAVKSF